MPGYCPGGTGKQSELSERQSALILRDDEEDGAPPHRTMMDLEGGTAVVRMPRVGRPVGQASVSAERAQPKAAPSARTARSWRVGWTGRRSR
ncbi:DUF6191 domain-containing protein [Streptomyces sp. NBC_00199]|uniref:DUF6191 domain-containing protein n=1 Tax=Streptomyces sp. NBC_00199 TaxID=2975678 RepID=UPI002B1DD6B0|nr:DUF6191 domain-containing protein [Streptomyces sp. NBC_00199]